MIMKELMNELSGKVINLLKGGSKNSYIIIRIYS